MCQCAIPPGRSAAHCSGCHRSFLNVSAFDLHQVADVRYLAARNIAFARTLRAEPAPGRVLCVDPGILGLAERDGLWGTPQGHAHRQQIGAILREAQAGKPTGAPAGFSQTPS